MIFFQPTDKGTDHPKPDVVVPDKKKNNNNSYN